MFNQWSFFKIVFKNSTTFIRVEKSKCSCSLKNNKQSVNNCLPISFLPICGKIFECLLHNSMFEIFMQNFENQSRFRLSDPCTTSYVVTHNVYNSFDMGIEVRGVYQKFLKLFADGRYVFVFQGS